MTDTLPPPLRIAIIDDQPMVREGLALLLELQEGLKVIGQGSDGSQALSLCAELRPDVLLMDIRMPVSGIEATIRLKAAGGPPVILLTTFEDSADIAAAIRAGADGFLFKNAELGEIDDAIRRVLRGEKAIHPRVAELLCAEQAPAPLSAPLTERESELLAVLAAGATNKQAARRLGISEGTVKAHLANLMRKLGAANRTEAVHRARELRLLP